MKLYLIVLLPFLFSVKALACKCTKTPTKGDYQKADIYFEGEVLESHFKSLSDRLKYCGKTFPDDPETILINYKIKRLKTIKKSAKISEYVEYHLQQKFNCRDSCHPPTFYKGEKYAFAAYAVNKNRIKVSFSCGKWGHDL